MRYSVKMIIDIPYSSYIQKTIRLIADDPEGLITEVIPKRACRELDILKETVWKKTGWKHAGIKFCFHGLKIDFISDQVKTSVAAVYISRLSTGEILSASKPSFLFEGESSLAEEVAKRAVEAQSHRRAQE